MITFGTWELVSHDMLITVEVDCTYPQLHSMVVYHPGERDCNASGPAL